MPLIFSVAPSKKLDLGAVIKSAYRVLEGSVTVLQETGCVYDSSRKQGSGRDEFGTCLGYEQPFGALLLIQLKGREVGVYRVTPRQSTDADFEAAKAAAAKLEKADLYEIAARCQTVWEVVADSAPEFEAAPSNAPGTLLSMCAVLAGAARGPVLLDDGTLLDPKGTQERAKQLLSAAA